MATFGDQGGAWDPGPAYQIRRPRRGDTNAPGYLGGWQDAQGQQIGTAQDALARAQAGDTTAQQQLQQGFQQTRGTLGAQGAASGDPGQGRAALYATDTAGAQTKLQSQALRSQEMMAARQQLQDAYAQQMQGEMTWEQMRQAKDTAAAQEQLDYQRMQLEEEERERQFGLQFAQGALSTVGMVAGLSDERMKSPARIGNPPAPQDPYPYQGNPFADPAVRSYTQQPNRGAVVVTTGPSPAQLEYESMEEPSARGAQLQIRHDEGYDDPSQSRSYELVNQGGKLIAVEGAPGSAPTPGGERPPWANYEIVYVGKPQPPAADNAHIIKSQKPTPVATSAPTSSGKAQTDAGKPIPTPDQVKTPQVDQEAAKLDKLAKDQARSLQVAAASSPPIASTGPRPSIARAKFGGWGSAITTSDTATAGESLYGNSGMSMEDSMAVGGAFGAKYGDAGAGATAVSDARAKQAAYMSGWRAGQKSAESPKETRQPGISQETLNEMEDDYVPVYRPPQRSTNTGAVRPATVAVYQMGTDETLSPVKDVTGPRMRSVLGMETPRRVAVERQPVIIAGQSAPEGVAVSAPPKAYKAAERPWYSWIVSDAKAKEKAFNQGVEVGQQLNPMGTDEVAAADAAEGIGWLRPRKPSQPAPKPSQPAPGPGPAAKTYQPSGPPRPQMGFLERGVAGLRNIWNEPRIVRGNMEVENARDAGQPVLQGQVVPVFTPQTYQQAVVGGVAVDNPWSDAEWTMAREHAERPTVAVIEERPSAGVVVRQAPREEPWYRQLGAAVLSDEAGKQAVARDAFQAGLKMHAQQMAAAEEQGAIDDESRTTMRSLQPYAYRYKPQFQQAMGLTNRVQVGPSAQQLEQTPMGASVVYDTPAGKQVDLKGATMQQYALAAANRHDIDLVASEVQQLKHELGHPQRGYGPGMAGSPVAALPYNTIQPADQGFDSGEMAPRYQAVEADEPQPTVIIRPMRRTMIGGSGG